MFLAIAAGMMVSIAMFLAWNLGVALYLGGMDFWIPLLGSALGGAIITSLFGLVKVRQDRTNEHQQWLRNQKLEVYVEMTIAMFVWVAALDAAFESKKLDREPSELSSSNQAKAMFISSNKVQELFIDHFYNIHQAWEVVKRKDAFEAAREKITRSELKLHQAIREDLDLTGPRTKARDTHLPTKRVMM